MVYFLPNCGIPTATLTFSLCTKSYSSMRRRFGQLNSISAACVLWFTCCLIVAFQLPPFLSAHQTVFLHEEAVGCFCLMVLVPPVVLWFTSCMVIVFQLPLLLSFCAPLRRCCSMKRLLRSSTLLITSIVLWCTSCMAVVFQLPPLLSLCALTQAVLLHERRIGMLNDISNVCVLTVYSCLTIVLQLPPLLSFSA